MIYVVELPSLVDKYRNLMRIQFTVFRKDERLYFLDNFNFR